MQTCGERGLKPQPRKPVLTRSNMTRHTALAFLLSLSVALAQQTPQTENREWRDAVVMSTSAGTDGSVGIATGSSTTYGGYSSGTASVFGIPLPAQSHVLRAGDTLYLVKCGGGWSCK